MRVESLVLEDFRNYRRAHLEPSPGLNLVVGRNAQGKTNLLEAVYCLSGLGSPRSPDAALLREGAERALLHGRIRRGDRSIELDLELGAGRTRALINKAPAPRPGALAEIAVSVFFGPDELSLVKGSPEGRRRFLDDLVVKLRPARGGLRREWERVLRQRNALLKSIPRKPGAAAAQTLEIWDDALARAGAGLAAARLEALDQLTPLAGRRFRQVAGDGRLELRYTSAWMDQGDDGAPEERDEARLGELLSKAVVTARTRELERGMSLVGPQRDDIVVRLTSSSQGDDLLDARSHASQGEQRTSALALKLGEFDLVTETLREEPILLLDDVFSELDPQRRSWLGDAVRAAGQTLLSSAEPGAVEAIGPGRVIEVRAGSLVTDG